ncbi:hypothetical protein [Pseudonocardia sp. ICBG601]|uniref:hypothetical protein n=1 Tax=Pseudonocardia sp. ICBG601 TaxID=2846759 RepID=UPI001CF61343|nr:hypothetical protein [Pseudonocardia sp. ICBG601]
MKYFGLKLTITLILIISTLSGFLITKELDNNEVSLDSALVEIFDDRNNVAWPQVVTVLEAVARQYHVNIIRVDESFYNGDRLRNVHVMPSEAGAEQAKWAQDYLAPFGQSPKADLAVNLFETENVLDPRAGYQVIGSDDAASDLMSRLEELGLFGTQSPSHPLWLAVISYTLNSIELFSSLLAGLAALTVGSVLLNVKRYAIWRLHGITLPGIVYRDMRVLAKFLILTLFLFAVLSSAFLFWYNKWNQIYTFIRLSVFIGALIFAVQITVYCMVVVIASSASVTSALKGKINLSWAIITLYPLRICTILLTVTALLGVFDSYTGMSNRNSALPYIPEMEGLANITFSGYRTEKESNRDFEKTGKWLRELDNQGRIIIVKRGLLENGLSVSTPSGGTEIIHVNDTFLAKNPIFTQDKIRIGSTPKDTINVVIPERLAPHTEEILNMVSKWFTPEALPDGVPVPHIQQLVSANGQNIFAYASNNSDLDSPAANRPIIQDPVVIALPNGSPLIFDESLAAHASYNGIVLLSRDIIFSKEKGLFTGNILGMIPLQGLLGDNYLAEVNQFVSRGTALGLSIVASLLATATYYLTYTRRSSSTILVEHILGRTFWRTHWRMLTCEVVIIPLGILSWTYLDNLNRGHKVAEYLNASIPPPPSALAPDWWRLIPMMSTSGVMTVLFIALLYAAHRRMVAARTIPLFYSKEWIR